MLQRQLTIDTSPSVQDVFDRCCQAVPSLKMEPITTRKSRLSALRKWIHANRSRIHQAVFDDFRKPSMEADATEIFHVLNEIKAAMSSLDDWAAPIPVRAPLFLSGTRSWIRYEPRGVCLIISPWNYPFGLAAGPLVSALAAGNSIILKPSEHAPTVSALLKSMCADIFDPAVVNVCEGGVEVSQALLALPFDHIFFTGSPAVGKIVMKAAAEHLTSVTLELGGKSPTIISDSANIAEAAERVAVGKFINNGQTCIAPDYVLADEKVAAAFVNKLIESTQSLFAADGDFEKSPDYARIVNEAHFLRLQSLIDDAVSRGAKIAWQGKVDQSSRFMHPVMLTDVPIDCRLMNEEIFGPVLPVISYHRIEDALEIIQSKPKPLALYLFSASRALQRKVLNETTSGTACINDCGIQFLHHGLPFGGVNHSGIGIAHGQFGFRAFSNEKPVLKQKSGVTAIKVFYPPFTRRTKQFMDWFLRLF